MRLIRELYAPEIAFLPIGDHYTMGPDAAAIACEMLGVRQVVPMHYGTFPLLTGTPDRLEEACRRRRGSTSCPEAGRNRELSRARRSSVASQSRSAP